MAIWTFFDYVSPSGTNQIHAWFDDLSLDAQSIFNDLINILIKNVKLSEPDVKPLSGAKFKGLLEIKFKADKREHRVIGFYWPRGNYQFTLLIGCFHKQKRYNPTNALETAAKRKSEIESGAASCTEHELNR